MKLLAKDDAKDQQVIAINTHKETIAIHYASGDATVIRRRYEPFKSRFEFVTDYNKLDNDELFYLGFITFFEYQATNDSRDR